MAGFGAFENDLTKPVSDEQPGSSTLPPPPPPRVEVAPPSAVQPPHSFEIDESAYTAGMPHICESRRTSIFLYDAFVELVRKVYRDGIYRLVGTPSVKWGKTPQHDEIWIDTEYNWKPEHPEFLPAIFVKIPQVQYSSRINNQNAGAGMILEDGVYKYERVGTGSVSFVHVSGTSGEAIALCDNTRYHLNEFATPIMDDLCFTKFFESQVQPLAPAAKDSKERYQSVATFNFEFVERWDLKLESPILRSVEFLQSRRKYDILSLEGTDRHLPEHASAKEFSPSNKNNRRTP